MASTQTELARRAREEIERLERAATRTLREDAPTTHRARLEQNRLVDAFLRASVERAKRLVRVSRPRARTDGRTDGRTDVDDDDAFGGGGRRGTSRVDGTKRGDRRRSREFRATTDGTNARVNNDHLSRDDV